MLFSIITINLNNKRGLERTAESIVNQTFKEYEWLVIDGGSTDGSRDIMSKYSNHISYWTSERDGGIYSAMNKGILAAHGDYILFLNSGDCLASESVLFNSAYLLDHRIIAGSVEIQGESKTILPPKELTPWYILEKNIPHQAEFIDSALFKEIGLYSEDLGILSDFEFNLKAAVKKISYKAINNRIAIVEPGGVSSINILKLQQEEDIIKKRVLPPGILQDYLALRSWKRKDLMAIAWAHDKRWPLRIIRRLYSIFVKKHSSDA